MNIALDFTAELYTIALVFLRLGAVLMTSIGFGETYVPGRIRLWLALWLSFNLGLAVIPPVQEISYLMLVTELLYGLFCGVLLRMLFSALEVVGSVIDLQISIGQGAIFNPLSMQPSAITSSLLSTAGATLFFVLNMHHQVIKGIVNSYTTFPPGAYTLGGDFGEFIIQLFSSSFVFAIHLGMPLLIISLALMLGLGLVNRLLPQIPIFFISHPLQIGIGLLLLITIINGLLDEFCRNAIMKIVAIFGGA